MKSVLITGASSGIGAAAAQLAAQKKWSVFVGYSKGRERAEAIAQDIKKQGGKAWPVFLPLDNGPEIDKGLDFVASQTTQLQALVLSASPPPTPMSFLQTTEPMLQDQYQAAVIGNQRLMVGTWKRFFQNNDSSHIVALLTIAIGPPPQPQLTSYLVAKEALHSLLACALAELGVRGLRVSTISPDFTDTPMLRCFDDHVLELVKEKQPQGKLMSVQKVARRVVQCLESPPVQSSIATHRVMAGDSDS